MTKPGRRPAGYPALSWEQRQATKTVFSGIQPTGAPHLGNYLGALRWWVDFQDRYDALYCVVDLHALTVPGDPEELSKATLTMATLLLAAGLDPSRCILFVQSHVHQHAELAWLLECTASMGELNRMTQWKDKAAKGGEESARVGLFAYPALMAADILLYNTDLVPVGDDQRQHLELTRDLAQRWNTRYGDTFTVPSAAIAPAGGGARIMDLQDPSHKMSKSTDIGRRPHLPFRRPEGHRTQSQASRDRPRPAWAGRRPVGPCRTSRGSRTCSKSWLP